MKNESGRGTGQRNRRPGEWDFLEARKENFRRQMIIFVRFRQYVKKEKVLAACSWSSLGEVAQPVGYSGMCGREGVREGV